jgi:hypothetical protein
MNNKNFKVDKKTGYAFNKWIFRGVTIALLIMFIISFFIVGFKDRVYAYCPENSFRCDNPFYKNCNFKGNDSSVLFARALCDQEYLIAGTRIGAPPNWFMKNSFYLDFLIIVLGFGVNHFLYNSRVKRFWRVEL